MGASLSWSVSVSNTSNTQAKVTVTLKVKSTSGSYNYSSQSGYITIDGTKYTFSHSFSPNTTTTLATKSKTISRTTASKSISIKASYSTGVSPGTITKSGSTTVSARPSYTVTFNGNGGTTTTKTVYYGYTTTFPTSAGTKTGYTLSGWTNGSTTYSKGATTPTITGNITFTAKWTVNTYTVTFNANGGTNGTTKSMSRTYGSSFTIPAAAIPTRTYYNFKGWATASTATSPTYVHTGVTSGTCTISAYNSSTAAITLYAVWELAFVPPSFDISKTVPQRWDSSTQKPEQDSKVAYIPVTWVNGKNADQSAAQVTSVKYEYKLSTDSAWTTLATHSISSGTTDSLTTDSIFSTTLAYDIRITISDANASAVYETFVSKASFIWKAQEDDGNFVLGVSVEMQGDIILQLDDTAGSGTDYEILQALETLRWDVTP